MKTRACILTVSVAIIFACLACGLRAKAEEEELEFSLMDSYGREVSSQDYKGVPIFLEFGACW
ncbi:MAG: hypothetical protein JSU70_02020 [Phycisphaerales bacterium]|nr:MAG: hypothetical protein JSU70_02020 [Phycisphaerales bacterium]